MDDKVKRRLIRKLRNDHLTIDELAESFGVGVEEMKGRVGALQNSGIPVDIRQKKDGSDLLYHIRVLPDIGNVFHISDVPDNRLRVKRFAVASDIHLASKFHLTRSFHESLDRLEGNGIRHVYVAGDILDGVGVYRGHLENLLAVSLEDQTDIAAEAFSQHPNLHFWVIAGNHDYSFTKKNGAKPLAVLEAKVDNITNLGDFRADIIHHGIHTRLLHGGSGRAYAKSYPSQTYLREYFSGLQREEMKSIPHLLVLGHYHTLYNGFDHGMHILQPGSFQDGNNEFCIRRGLNGPIGLWEVRIKHKGDEIREFTTTYHIPVAAMEEKGAMHARNTRSYHART